MEMVRAVIHQEHDYLDTNPDTVFKVPQEDSTGVSPPIDENSTALICTLVSDENTLENEIKKEVLDDEMSECERDAQLVDGHIELSSTWNLSKDGYYIVNSLQSEEALDPLKSEEDLDPLKSEEVLLSYEIRLENIIRKGTVEDDGDLEEMEWRSNFFMSNQNLEDKYNNRGAESKVEIEEPSLQEFYLKGHRIVNLQYVLNWSMEIQRKHAARCLAGQMKIIDEQQMGLISIITFHCDHCGVNETHYTEDPRLVTSDLNVRAVHGTLLTGNGYNQLQELLTILEVPNMSERVFRRYEMEFNLWTLMEMAGREERELAVRNGQVDKDGVPWIEVHLEGGWNHHSFSTKFGAYLNAASGMAVIIGKQTQKLLYLGILKKFCTFCTRAASRHQEPTTRHKCFKHWMGSLRGVEPDIIVEGFNLSQKMYGVKYTHFISGGDSNLFRKMKKEVTYGGCLRKVSCLNRTSEDFGKELLQSSHCIAESARRLLSKKKIEQMQEFLMKILFLSASSEVDHLKFYFTNFLNHIYGDHARCKFDYCHGVGKNGQSLMTQVISSGLDHIINGILRKMQVKGLNQLIDKETKNRGTVYKLLLKFIANEEWHRNRCGFIPAGLLKNGRRNGLDDAHVIQKRKKITIPSPVKCKVSEREIVKERSENRICEEVNASTSHKDIESDVTTKKAQLLEGSPVEDCSKETLSEALELIRKNEDMYSGVTQELTPLSEEKVVEERLEETIFEEVEPILKIEDTDSVVSTEITPFYEEQEERLKEMISDEVDLKNEDIDCITAEIIPLFEEHALEGRSKEEGDLILKNEGTGCGVTKEEVQLSKEQTIEQKEYINNKKPWTRKNNCPFCMSEVTHFPRHLERHHKDEENVKELLGLSKDDPKRRTLLDIIRRHGNYILNKNISAVRPVRRSNSDMDASEAKKYLACQYCLGYYRKAYFRRHRIKCPLRYSQEKSSDRENQEQASVAYPEIKDKLSPTSSITPQKNLCPFCLKQVTHFSRHLLSQHSNEDNVKKILEMPSATDRRSAIIILRRKLNFVLRKEKNMTPRPVRLAGAEKEKTMDKKKYSLCASCCGLFRKSYMWRHRKFCKAKTERFNIKVEHRFGAGQEVTDNTSDFLGSFISKSGLTEVFKVIREDEIGAIARSDPVICLYGHSLLKNRNRKRTPSVVSMKLRRMAELLVVAQKSNFLEVLRPGMYTCILEAAKAIAGCNRISLLPCTVNINPSKLAMQMARDLKYMCLVAKRAIATKNPIMGPIGNPEEMRADISKLHGIIASHWRNDFASFSNELDDPDLLALAEDVAVFRNYTCALADEAYIKIINNEDVGANYDTLVTSTLALLVLCNRRSTDEVQFMDIENFIRQTGSRTHRDEMLPFLTKYERFLCTALQRVVVRGKKSKFLPIFFPKKLQKYIGRLIHIRRTRVVVAEENSFIFASSASNQRVCESASVEKLVYMCGSKRPQLLMGEGFRRHVAAMLQLMVFERDELAQVAQFMGYTEEMYTEFGSIQGNSYEIVKVVKILLKLDSGKGAQFKDKTLNEITLVDQDCSEKITVNEQPKLLSEEVIDNQQLDPLSDEIFDNQQSEALSNEVVDNQHPEDFREEVIDNQQLDALSKEIIDNQQPEALDKEVMDIQPHEALREEVIDNQQLGALSQEVTEKQKLGFSGKQYCDKHNETEQIKMNTIKEEIIEPEVLVGNNNDGRVKWQPYEKKIVLEWFKNHVDNRIAPKKVECLEFINYHSEFEPNDWVRIKTLVFNTYFRTHTQQRDNQSDGDNSKININKEVTHYPDILKRNICRGRVRWEPYLKRIVLERFKKHIDNRITPKKWECMDLINEYPEFHQSDWLRIKTLVFNTYRLK